MFLTCSRTRLLCVTKLQDTAGVIKRPSAAHTDSDIAKPHLTSQIWANQPFVCPTQPRLSAPYISVYEASNCSITDQLQESRREYSLLSALFHSAGPLINSPACHGAWYKAVLLRDAACSAIQLLTIVALTGALTERTLGATSLLQSRGMSSGEFLQPRMCPL